ncbi:hypothetical protein ACFLVP_01110 [Chloroflexota bacterium]
MFVVTQKAFAGDDIIEKPNAETTYGVTINAPASVIWPWLVQMGYHRAGWYIDTWWDAWSGRYFWPAIVPESARALYLPPANRIIPELQSLKVGDIVPDGPPNSAFFYVVGMEKNKHLLLHSTSHVGLMTPAFLHGSKLAAYGEFSWAFILDRIDEHTTTLKLRMRAIYGPRLLMTLLKPLLFIIDYVHVREMLKGIKHRVERV